LTETFELEEDMLRGEITRRGSRRVLIQLPEGLKGEGLRLARVVEEAGALPIISADPCYGACDIAIDEARRLNADLIVHYGHSELILDVDIPTIYIEARSKVQIDGAIEDSLRHLEEWGRIGLATTVQHIHRLDEARRMLNKAGKTVVVGDAGRMRYPGQVIGCEYSNALTIKDEVEAFLFLGGGRFHALGLALTTMKPVVVADPFEGRAYPIGEDEVQKVIRQRWINIAQAREAGAFGILVGMKIGQTNLNSALRLKRYLRECGKDAVLLALREINAEALREFPSIEAFVNTGCPRVSTDDLSTFEKPVLNVNEALVMLGRMRWEDLLEGRWFER